MENIKFSELCANCFETHNVNTTEKTLSGQYDEIGTQVETNETYVSGIGPTVFKFLQCQDCGTVWVQEQKHYENRQTGGLNESNMCYLLTNHYSFRHEPIGPITADTIQLFRLVGCDEYEAVKNNGFSAWLPPKSSEYFYCKINHTQTNKIGYDRTLGQTRKGHYHQEMERKWGLQENETESHVMKFYVRSSFLNQHLANTTGTGDRVEYRIPAMCLEDLNDNIVGEIKADSHYKKRKPNERG